MAKPNYNYEKRQREFAKKKQDQKLARKREARDAKSLTDDATSGVEIDASADS